VIITLVLFTSCEEIIDVELNDAEPQLVVEATLFPNEQPKVFITKTTDFFEPKTENYVSDALVSIRDNEGNSADLVYHSNGYYSTGSFLGEVGKTYTMQVTVDGETHFANSTIYPKNELDTIEIENVSSPMGGDEQRMVQVKLESEANAEMYSRVKVVKNGENLNQYFVSQSSMIPLRYRFEKGDTLEIQMLTLDKEMYYYFRTLSDIAGEHGMPSSSPANPVTNWDKDILGYFGAMNIEKRFLILQ
ncbi:MAG: DUF4249 domain-containing protein, partial [Bacteroidales bacterium]|nr:DUF4249 domain-containing protein [Bacteroidales bacterium]